MAEATKTTELNNDQWTNIPPNDLGVIVVMASGGVQLSQKTLAAIVSPDGMAARGIENLVASEGAEPSQLPM